VLGVLQVKGSSSGFANPDDSIYIPITTALKQLLGHENVDNIIVGATNAEAVKEVSQEVESLLRQQHRVANAKEQDFYLMTPQQAISIMGNIMGILTGMLSAVAAVSLLVGGIGIMNIMLVTVTERTREIGLLKAIGAQRQDILTQFLIEAIVITVCGGLIGLTLGMLFAYLISSAINIPFIVGLNAIIIAVGASSLVGIIFGYYPASRASKLSPIEALRYE